MVSLTPHPTTTKKILFVNSFLSPYGGAEGVLAQEAQWLEARGHQIYFFGTDAQRDLWQYPAERCHTTPDPDPRGAQGRWGQMRAIGQSIINSQAEQDFNGVVQSLQPDVVHVHNLHYHLTPSLLNAPVLKQANRPRVVVTLHDLRWMCPSGMWQPGHTACQAGNPWPCLKVRCKNNRLSETAYGLLERALHRGRVINHPAVDGWICPSEAVRSAYVQAGWSPQQLTVLHNPMAPAWVHGAQSHSLHPRPHDAPWLFVGRLSREKGVDRLIQAMGYPLAGGQKPERPLWIVGQGPEREWLESMVASLEAEGRVRPGQIQFIGHCDLQRLAEIYGTAFAMVQPCRWFEAFGLTVWEAFAMGTPVLASKSGALGEWIQPQVTGDFVDSDPGPKGADDDFIGQLALTMVEWEQNPQRVEEMGCHGHRWFLHHATEDRHGEGLWRIYQGSIQAPSSPPSFIQTSSPRHE